MPIADTKQPADLPDWMKPDLELDRYFRSMRRNPRGGLGKCSPNSPVMPPHPGPFGRAKRMKGRYRNPFRASRLLSAAEAMRQRLKVRPNWFNECGIGV